MSRQPRSMSCGRGRGQDVEALLRIEPADHAQDRSVVAGVHPVAGQQIGPAQRLAGQVRRGERRGEELVRGRIPDRGVQPVEDPDEPIAQRPQDHVQAHPELGREGLGRVARRDRVDQVGALDAGGQQIDPVGVLAGHPIARPQPELGQGRVVGPAVVGQVVQGHDHGRRADDRVVGVAQVAQDRGRSGLPVVEVDDIDRPAVGAQRLERRPAVQPEAPGVVGEVARRVAIERRPVEGGRVIDQAQPIAADERRDDGHVADPGRPPRVRARARRVASVSMSAGRSVMPR